MSEAAARFDLAYGRVAEAYLRLLEPTLAPVARRLVELAGVGDGTRVLDLATGTGVVARAARAQGAEAVGIDVAAAMIATARTASPALEFLVADAAQLPFEEASFDAVTCSFGLSHMLDPPPVLGEVRRVMRPGGRFVASAWGSDGDNPASEAVRAELQRCAGRDTRAFADLVDERTWADADKASRLLAEAGFRVEVVREPLEGRFADARAALDWTLAWPGAGKVAASLPLVERRRFEQAALAAAAQTELVWRYAVNYVVAGREE